MKITQHPDPLEDTEIKFEHLPMHKLGDLDVIGIDPTQLPTEDRTSYIDYLDSVTYEAGQIR
ncbi:hypothetical protein E2C01_023722 [Portunus trituberculatus]|uniref:Uncharacterized protein n=1 Tax=Portunus trituberculatus TaxID=210409 RepID=A0A5B7EAS8_PORTR|nr:hypothetical protein [Portunus trituberculatus]